MTRPKYRKKIKGTGGKALPMGLCGLYYAKLKQRILKEAKFNIDELRKEEGVKKWWLEDEYKEAIKLSRDIICGMTIKEINEEILCSNS